LLEEAFGASPDFLEHFEMDSLELFSELLLDFFLLPLELRAFFFAIALPAEAIPTKPKLPFVPSSTECEAGRLGQNLAMWPLPPQR
jgi:hypothetical protein